MDMWLSFLNSKLHELYVYVSSVSDKNSASKIRCAESK